VEFICDANEIVRETCEDRASLAGDDGDVNMYVQTGHMVKDYDESGNVKLHRLCMNVCPSFYEDYNLNGPFNMVDYFPRVMGRPTRASIIFHEMSHLFLISSDDYGNQEGIYSLDEVYSLPQNARDQVAYSWELYFDGIYFMRTLMSVAKTPAELSNMMASDLTKVYFEWDVEECQKYDFCKNIPGLKQT
jgi:hypothetical protein